MKLPGFGGKLADTLKNTAASLAERGTELANKAMDSETIQRAGDKVKDAITQVQQNKSVQEAQETIVKSVGQFRETDLGKKIESLTAEAVQQTRDTFGEISDQLAYGSDAPWIATVKNTLRVLRQEDAIHFLQTLQPAALVKAMYCPETIDVMRKSKDAVDLTPAEALYPGLIKTWQGHTVLESSSLTIAKAVQALSPAPSQPDLAKDTGPTMEV